jgi:hypothetical protein
MMGTPEEVAQVPPRDLHATSDIRFVMLEIGKFSSEVQNLAKQVEKSAEKVSELDKTVDRFKVALYSVGACLTIFLPVMGGVVWWAVGERINAVLRPVPPPIVIPAPVPPPLPAPPASRR